MTIVFETERLYLRRFTLEDSGLILDLNSDPIVLKFLHEPILTNRRHALTILRDTILPQYELNLGRWAVHLKNGNEFIGWCGLKSRPELNEIDVGYRFKRISWGNGYAYEAAKSSVEFGFNQLLLPEIIGRAHVENTGSIRVLEKIGMEFTGNDVIEDQPVKTYKLSLEKFIQP